MELNKENILWQCKSVAAMAMKEQLNSTINTTPLVDIVSAVDHLY